jgi:hypothetical protein
VLEPVRVLVDGQLDGMHRTMHFLGVLHGKMSSDKKEKTTTTTTRGENEPITP